MLTNEQRELAFLRSVNKYHKGLAVLLMTNKQWGQELMKLRRVLRLVKMSRGNVWLVGNGGSGTTCEHIAQDMAKQLGIRAASLTSTPVITAYGNDEKFEVVFKRQLEVQVRPRDVVIFLSGSGKSPNVVEAVKLANAHGAITVGFTADCGGSSGGGVRQFCDTTIMVPTQHMGQAEDCHLMLLHMLVYGMMDEDRVIAEEGQENEGLRVFGQECV